MADNVKNLEELKQQAQEMGQEAVEKKLDDLIHKYQELNKDPKCGRGSANPEEAEQVIIMAMVYPDLEKKMKRMEELYSTLQATINPIEGQKDSDWN